MKLVVAVLLICLLSGCVVIGSNNTLSARGAGMSSRSAFESPSAVHGMEGGGSPTLEIPLK